MAYSRRGDETIHDAAVPMSGMKTNSANIFAKLPPKRNSAMEESGASALLNFSQPREPMETKTSIITIAAIDIVEITIIFGRVFLGFFTSSERYVAVSHPKNVSAIKYVERNMDEKGKIKNGLKFPISVVKNPGTKRIRSVNIVMMPKKTSIFVDRE